MGFIKYLGNMSILKYNSIPGKFFRFYLILGLVILLGCFLAYFQIRRLQDSTYTISRKYETVKNASLQIRIDLNQVVSLSYNYLLFHEMTSQSQARAIWNKRLQPHLQDLVRTIQEFDDPELRQQIFTLRKDLMRLEEMWGKFFQAKVFEEKEMEKLDRSFTSLANKIQKDLIQIASDQDAAIQFGVTRVNTAARWIFITAIAVIVIALALSMLFSSWLVQALLQAIRRFRIHLKNLVWGEIPPPLDDSLVELHALNLTINRLTTDFENLKKLADEVSSGKFDTDISVFEDQGVLGDALAKMSLSLQQIAKDNRERNWINEGFARFAEVLRRNSRRGDAFYEILVRNLVEYLEVNQGGIFAINDDIPGNPPFMELMASYAYQRKKFLTRKIYQEEGLIGQAWRERDVVYITDIPEDYADITSGLGKAKPSCILIVPLITNDDVLGILEIASFAEVPPYKISFVERLGESIATTIARLKVDSETKRLLDESQSMAERMRAQEEEMKQGMEELVTTQEKMEQNALEMKSQLKALDEAFIMLEMDTSGRFIKVNDLFLQLSGYSEEELINRHFSILLRETTLHENLQEDWDSIMRGHYVKGDSLRYKKNGDKFWIHEVIYPLYNTEGDINKVCVVGHDITKQKEQDRKIKEQLNELYMSKRDVVNRIREVEGKARNKILKLKMDFQEQLQEKERIITELREYQSH